MVNFDNYSDSYGRYSSIASNPTEFQRSAALAEHAIEDTRYSFVAVLGLAQRLGVEFLPIIWDNSLDTIGSGGQARVNHQFMNLQMSFAFKRFDHESAQDPLREFVQELLILTHPAVFQHQYIIKLEGIMWDIINEEKIWPVLVFEKTHFGDLYKFARSVAGKKVSMYNRLEICADIGVAIRDMHANSKELIT